MPTNKLVFFITDGCETYQQTNYGNLWQGKCNTIFVHPLPYTQTIPSSGHAKTNHDQAMSANSVTLERVLAASAAMLEDQRYQGDFAQVRP